MARVVVVIFLAGVVVGVVGTILVPRVAAPYIPAGFRDEATEVDGRVAGKLREAGRLLLTIESDRGSVLATFTERVSEIDLLVATGDEIVISMPEYEPFAINPPIEHVARATGQVPPAGDVNLATPSEPNVPSGSMDSLTFPPPPASPQPPPP